MAYVKKCLACQRKSYGEYKKKWICLYCRRNLKDVEAECVTG